MLSDCSIAGISRLQIDAATITPAAKPASERCTISLSDFFIKNTHAEPSVVPIKGISMPIKVSITSPSSYKKFVSCQLNYTTTVGIMIPKAEISLELYHLLLCGGVNLSSLYQAARNQCAPFFPRLPRYYMLYFVHRLNTDTLLENCFDKYIV